MRNLAVILCIALLATAPWGAESRSIQDSLEAAKEKVYNIIDGAINKAQEVIAHAKEQAVALGQKLENIVDGYQTKLDEQAQEILAKIDGKLDEILGELENPDASECRIFADIVRDTVVATIVNETKCVTSKMDSGKKYVSNIYDLSAEIITDLKELRQQAHRCTEKTYGIKATVEAVVCLNKAGAKAAWVSATRVPEITANAVGLGILVQTLPVALPTCAIENGVVSVLENTGDLLKGVTKCVSEAVKGGKVKPEVPKVPEVPEQTEVPDVPEVPEQTEAPAVPEQTEVPEVPEAPEQTVAPEDPEQSEVPEQTEVPEVPKLPEQTEVPEVPEAPEQTVAPEDPEQSEVPEQTEVPEVPQLPEQTEVPEVPEAPEQTVAPEDPEQSEVPEQTEVPEVPQLPEQTEVPEISEVPEQTEVSEVSELPEQTEVPEVPQVSEQTNKAEFPEFPGNLQ